MGRSETLLSQDIANLADLIAAYAVERPEARALVQDGTTLTYRALDRLMDRIAAGLQRDGVTKGQVVAILAATTPLSAAVYLAALRAGAVPAPIAPSSTTAQIAGMVSDSGAPILFADAEGAALSQNVRAPLVDLDKLDAWLPGEGERPKPVTIAPDDAFNIIYSSGTTGTPKGIVHTHGMRWTQIRAYAATGFSDAVTIVATPLYSNTTLVSLLPTLAYGGTAVLLGKFDARRFLEVAERERATHVMLVPVQYQRIMADPEFDSFDLNCFRFKSATSAPFAAELKADVVARWPGMLMEIYGMTEGGGTCLLFANLSPAKLHTVGQPAPGSDVRLIDEEGHEVPRGEIGEVVGRSGVMMAGYHNRSEATDAAAWYDADGNRYIRHGDLGRFDEDGFLTLLGRSKDMIISGGFNIYPPDLEEVMQSHPGVGEAAVIGIPSERWGETPFGFYVPRAEGVDAAALVDWVNARVGKTQRLSGAEAIAELPRNAIGKILKRELRDRFATA
ncbi:MAG: acyl--CoA ligase [Novosphingobium sp.]|nr:acyl--CoA ligase [Novosphingobium sp.]